MKYKRVLFICKDNSTLGPFAESVFKSFYEGPEISISSKGLVVLFEGPVNPKVEIVLSSHNIPLVRTVTSELRESDFDRETLVIALSRAWAEMFHEKYPLINVFSLGSYVGVEEITDPYGGTLIDYEKCFGELSVAIRKLIERLADM